MAANRDMANPETITDRNKNNNNPFSSGWGNFGLEYIMQEFKRLKLKMKNLVSYKNNLVGFY